MSLYLMADSEYEEFKRLELVASTMDASVFQSAAKTTNKMRIENGTAYIPIKGMLTGERISFLDFFGKPQTVWSDITGQANEAVDKGIRNIELEVDSGGGSINGMFEAMDDIATIDARVTGRIVGQAQSAAYMLLTQAESIEAEKEHNMVGSVGVKVAVPNVKEVSNSDSPDKPVGAKDESGKPSIVKALDDIYSLILPRMAEGRGTSIDKINSDWGKGSTMTAKTALSVGMIDSIRATKPAGRSGATKGSNMNRDELKAQHPDLFNAVFAEGKEAGKAEFQELASTHVELAKISGDNERALADIAAGNVAGPACTVHHTKVATNKTMINARGEEAPAPVGEGADPQASAHADEKKKEEDAIADELEASAKSFYGSMEVINV